MKAAMSLEYIVKIIILLVVASVIILLITNFYDEIRTTVKCWFDPEKCSPKKLADFPKTITKDTFSSGEIVTYIDSCLSNIQALPEVEQKDIVCYILMATSGFRATRLEVIALLPNNIKDKVEIETDFTKDYVKIEFLDVGDKIKVTHK
ncbi:MAG: hypothetical protein QXQ40_01860 [Candidatus Aenigmatarchaeota archaeon]